MPGGDIFWQGGAPCPNHNDVTSYLNAEVPVWLGHEGVTEWPPRLPDLSQLDFSLWSFVKDQVYIPFPMSIPDLESRICAFN
ncbi:uncharacterized protein TNCV_2669921 [Trichonephila clavipes]|nr:uncharacterized protein TNCV_2669921 [Trichonephila clavipes]